MGGQACILYGAAEFSRDIDLAVLATDKNVHALSRALEELRAEPVFVPPLSKQVLLRGHACHFRAPIGEAKGFRIDIMSVMHGCDPFLELWKRRRTLRLPGIGSVHVLAISDLVRAKKTQRDRDWPMVRRLVEIDFHRQPRVPTRTQVHFWFQEARTPKLLIDLCRLYPKVARRIAEERPAVRAALRKQLARVEKELRIEEEQSRAADRAYWQPLREELFRWRRA
jgi:hypothetical protein